MKVPVLSQTNGFSLPPEESEMNKNSGWKRKARTRVKEVCTVELLRRRFPICIWLPKYNWDFAVYDLIAGITVGLTTIPQGIAYAAVAGVPLQVKTVLHLITYLKPNCI